MKVPALVCQVSPSGPQLPKVTSESAPPTSEKPETSPAWPTATARFGSVENAYFVRGVELRAVIVNVFEPVTWTQYTPFSLGLVIAKLTLTRPCGQAESAVRPCGVEVVKVTKLPDCTTLLSVPPERRQLGSP